MNALARFLAVRRNAWIVVVLTLLLTAGAGALAGRVEQDDDLFAFLPEDNADIVRFRAIAERFGSLDVALVGIEGVDVFDAAFLAKLDETTEAVGALEDVVASLSITNLQDVEPDEYGGIRLGTVVGALPEDEEEEAAVRERVMSRDHVVGNFVSADGGDALLYAFLASDADPREASGAVQALVRDSLPGATLHWGGAPFISTWIYESTQRDMNRLTPWSVAVIVLILIVSFRDFKGALLALSTTGVGIAVANAAMVLTGTPLNIVLSSMPIILFAVGSAYAIHILARFYRLQPEHGTDEALRLTLVGLGPIVAASGLTTMAGLGSFVMMDIGPMKSFGAFTSLGIGTALLLSLTFVPAAIVAFGFTGRDSGLGVEGATAALTTFARKHALVGVPLMIALLAASWFFVGRVETRMDSAAFFTEGTPPDVAERFMQEQFGGAQFLMLHLDGDLTNPMVLRELQKVADRLLLIDGAADAQHVAGVVAQANEAIEGSRRVPDNTAKVGLMLALLRGNQAVSQLVDGERTEALAQIKLSVSEYDQLERVLQEAEEAVSKVAAARWTPMSTKTEEGRAHLLQRVALRARALFAQYGVVLPADVDVHEGDADVEGALDNLDADPDEGWVLAQVKDFLSGDENFASLPPNRPQLWDEVAGAVVARGPGITDETLAGVVEVVTGSRSMADDICTNLGAALSEAWAQAIGRARADALLAALDAEAPEGPRGQRFLTYLAGAMQDLDVRTELVSSHDGENTLAWSLTGQPVLYRGLARSVEGNQVRSLFTALGLVFVILALLFRSVPTGLLATVPTATTLLLVYGAMGAAGVTLDIGTSMLASLIIGAGVDYAVHYVSAWHAPEGEPMGAAAPAAARATATAIWANALMVAAGFFVLTLGEAKPLQNVGLLTSAAMVVAAMTTFVLVPMLAMRRSFAR